MPGLLPGDERAERDRNRINSLVDALRDGPKTAKQIREATGMDESTIHMYYKRFLKHRHIGTRKTGRNLARVYFIRTDVLGYRKDLEVTN